MSLIKKKLGLFKFGSTNLFRKHLDFWSSWFSGHGFKIFLLSFNYLSSGIDGICTFMVYGTFLKKKKAPCEAEMRLETSFGTLNQKSVDTFKYVTT